jgi:hypothetical protein
VVGSKSSKDPRDRRGQRQTHEAQLLAVRGSLGAAGARAAVSSCAVPVRAVDALSDAGGMTVKVHHIRVPV